MKIKKVLSLIAAAFMAIATNNAPAAQFIWNNTGTQFTSGTSWQGGVAPASTSSSTTTDELVFSNLTANFNTIDLTSNRSEKNFTFSTNANAYTFNTTSAKYFEVNNGITNLASNTQTFNTVVYNANASNTWNTATNGTTVFNNVVGITSSSSATSRTLTLAGGGTFTFNGILNNNGTASATSTSKVVINNAGGVVNLNNTNNVGSASGGGFTLTAGTVNINNASALAGGGILEIGGAAKLVNNSGAALTLAGIQSLLWTGVAPSAFTFGNTNSTSYNNIDLGRGNVTATTSRSMLVNGSGVTISMGALQVTGVSNDYDFTFDGTGNSVRLDGIKLLDAVSANLQNRNIKGSADIYIGNIVNGSSGGAQGISFKSTGNTYLTGTNTYTGATLYTADASSGSNAIVTISADNSAAVGAWTIAGTSGTSNKPVVRLLSSNAVSASTSLLGSSSTGTTGTLDFGGSTNVTMNAYLGNGITFSATNGLTTRATFTNVSSTITASSGNSGARTLNNNSANLTVVFDGATDIGSTTAGSVILNGAGTFDFKGALYNTNASVLRGLTKNGTGTLSLKGTNSYNGDTLLNGGTLLVNGVVGNVTSQSGTVIGGSGTFGNIILGGTLAPGNSPGLLTANNLNASNGIFQFELGAPTSRGITYDAVDVSGLLALASGTTFQFSNYGAYTFQMNDTYDLFNFATMDASTFDTNTLLTALNTGLVLTDADLKWDVNQFTTDGIVKVIPEPSAGSLFLIGLSALAGLRLYNRKK